MVPVVAQAPHLQGVVDLGERSQTHLQNAHATARYSPMKSLGPSSSARTSGPYPKELRICGPSPRAGSGRLLTRRLRRLLKTASTRFFTPPYSVGSSPGLRRSISTTAEYTRGGGSKTFGETLWAILTSARSWTSTA